VTFWPNTRLELRGAQGPCLAVGVAGVLAAAAPLGMPSGKIGHHPADRCKPLQGSASDHVPGWAPSRVPAPRTRYEACKSIRRFFHRRDRNKHPLPSASKCVRGRVCIGCAGLFFKRVCCFFDWRQYSGVWFLGILGILGI